jgi:glyoxylase-like metal-dependent hydrolase (beta-lactamase superfamily II)
MARRAALPPSGSGCRDAGAQARVAALIPPDIVDRVPLDLLGVITALPADAEQIPWDGPRVRIIEHQAHAPGHASLLIEERRVLVAADTLSDILIPLLDLSGTADPIEDYLDALRLADHTVRRRDRQGRSGVRGEAERLAARWFGGGRYSARTRWAG